MAINIMVMDCTIGDNGWIALGENGSPIVTTDHNYRIVILDELVAIGKIEWPVATKNYHSLLLASFDDGDQ
jgi:hypothetical protein